jgi:hypothetical protein
MSQSNFVSSVGDGYSSFLGSALATVVNVKVEAGGGPGGSISNNIHVCTTTEDVYHALNLTATTDLSTSWGSFHDRLEFAHSVTHNTRTVNIIVVASKVSSVEHAKSFTFSRKFKDPVQLYKEGGDGFVTQISKGAQFIVSL